MHAPPAEEENTDRFAENALTPADCASGVSRTIGKPRRTQRLIPQLVRAAYLAVPSALIAWRGIENGIDVQKQSPAYQGWIMRQYSAFRFAHNTTPRQVQCKSILVIHKRTETRIMIVSWPQGRFTVMSLRLDQRKRCRGIQMLDIAAHQARWCFTHPDRARAISEAGSGRCRGRDPMRGVVIPRRVASLQPLRWDPSAG
jgi:hypothetical protein